MSIVANLRNRGIVAPQAVTKSTTEELYRDGGNPIRVIGKEAEQRAKKSKKVLELQVTKDGTQSPTVERSSSEVNYVKRVQKLQKKKEDHEQQLRDATVVVHTERKEVVPADGFRVQVRSNLESNRFSQRRQK